MISVEFYLLPNANFRVSEDGTDENGICLSGDFHIQWTVRHVGAGRERNMLSDGTRTDRKWTL